MNLRSLLSATASVVVVVSSATGQADSTPPPIFQVTTLELTPSTISAYRSALQQQAEAAKAAGLSPTEMGWWAYFTDNRVVVVRPRSRDAMFANTGFRAAIRQANPAADSAIGAAFAEVEFQRGSIEIIQVNENNSYRPAGDPIEPDGAQVVDLVIAPGQGAAFQTAIREMIGIMGELKYPYPVIMHRVRYGEMRSQWVTFFDSREKFHGVNSFNRLFAANPELAKRAGPIYEAFLKTVSSIKTTEYGYAKALSFPPEN